MMCPNLSSFFSLRSKFSSKVMTSSIGEEGEVRGLMTFDDMGEGGRLQMAENLFNSFMDGPIFGNSHHSDVTYLTCCFC